MFSTDDLLRIRNRVWAEVGTYIEVDFEEGLAHHGICPQIWFGVDGEAVADLNWSPDSTVYEMVTYSVRRAGQTFRGPEDEESENFASLERATDRVIDILKTVRQQ
jgi:hypothetical protein